MAAFSTNSTFAIKWANTNQAFAMDSNPANNDMYQCALYLSDLKTYINANGGEVFLGTTNAFTNSTDSTSPTTGSNTFAGGVGILKALWVGGLANIAGLLTAAAGLVTDSITEKTAGKGITFLKNTVQNRTLAALNSTGTITAAMVNNGGITSTSGSAVTATIDTLANMVTQFGGSAGQTIAFVVDNIAGSNTVTVALPSGLTANKQVSSGDGAVAVLLTVAAGYAGKFEIYFTSTTVAVINRIW